MWFLMALLPFLGAVSAASSFANITLKATLKTTASSQAAASSCVGGFDCLRSGDPEPFVSEYYEATNPYEFDYSGPIASQCSESFESSLSSWEATAAIETSSLVYTPYSGASPTTSYTVDFDDYFTFAPAEPCCGNCTLFVGNNVHVFYWPTPAPTPGITKLVNAANFTFTSPSVYVAFSSLYATGLCGEVGTEIPSTTLGFAPGALSTALAVYNEYAWAGGYNLPDNFTAATFGNEPKGCPNETTEFYINYPDAVTWPVNGTMPATEAAFCSSMPESCDIEIFTMTYNPCSATLSVPSQLFSLNLLWKDCNLGIPPFIDPPYTLTEGGDLTAFNAPSTATSTVGNAQPETTPNPPTPTPTTAPYTSPTPDPTSSTDPSPSPDPEPSPSPYPQPSPSPPTDPSPPTEPSPSPNPSPDQNPSSNQNPASAPNAAPSPNPSPANTDAPGTTPIPFLVGTQTITPASPATVIFGTTYSVPSSGGAVVINNSITQSIANPQASSPVPFVVDTQTITPGAPAVVVSGTTYSAESSDGAVVINNSLTITPTETTSTGIGGAIVSIGGFTTPTSVAPRGTYTGISFQGQSSRMNVLGSFRVWIVGAGVTMFGILVL